MALTLDECRAKFGAAGGELWTAEREGVVFVLSLIHI